MADSIQNLFSTRVRLSYGNNQQQLMTELQNRFARFDVVDGRSTINAGSGSSGSSSSTGSISTTSSRNQGNQSTQTSQTTQGNQNIQGNQNTPTPTLDERLKQLTSVLDKLNGDGKGGSLANTLTGNADESQDLIDSSIRHQAAIYVGVIRPQNRVIVRTRDLDAMNEIKKIAKRLDVQSSMLLMEVKVLSIDLSDGYDSMFDFRIKSGDFKVSSFGGIGGALGDGILTNAGAAFSPALLATVVSNNFEARLQLLEKEGRVTSLATPVLLTSNQEVSRFFVGKEVPILTDYTARTTTTGGGTNNNTTIQQPTPEYTQYRVGRTLLLTPNI